MGRLFSTVSYLCWLAIPETAAAQSCAKLPTCAELGYEATGCPEEVTPMVCPFDNTKVYCPEDCREYKLTWCDETKGTCVRCGNGNNWKYESCKPGWYLSGYDCVENECPSYNKKSNKICGCETVSSCQKGNNKVYKCNACADGYELIGSDLCENKVNAVGDIYCYNNTAIGVIFSNDDNTTKIVGLENINESGQKVTNYLMIYWSTSSSSYDVDTLMSYTSETDAVTDMDGKGNTQKILAYIAANGYEAQAATATSLYAPLVCPEDSFCGAGQWYLPALGELQKIQDNLSTIQRNICSAGGTQMQHFEYWSSTEHDRYNAWTLYLSSSNRYDHTKYSTRYVRPVLIINSRE